MANLPANRTKLQAAITNQQPSIVASAQANREALIEAYDTIDLMNQKVDGLTAGGNLVPFPPDAISRQAIINGNFDVWQRGATRTDSTDVVAFLADRWIIQLVRDGGTLPTVVHSRLTLTPGDLAGAFYFHRINVNGAGISLGSNSQAYIGQKIENGTRFLCGAGKKVTVSFWAKSDIPGKKLGVNLFQDYGTGGSPSAVETLVGATITLSSTWTKYSFTFITNTLVGKTFGTNNDDSLHVRIQSVWGTNVASRFNTASAETFVGAGNIDIAQVQVNAGDAALPFQPRSFAEELALCQRYFWKTFQYAVAPAQGALNRVGAIAYICRLTGASFDGVDVRFPTRMRTIPTITFYNPDVANNKWRNTNLNADSGTPSANTPSESGFLAVNNPQVAGDALSHTLCIHATADAEL